MYHQYLAKSTTSVFLQVGFSGIVVPDSNPISIPFLSNGLYPMVKCAGGRYRGIRLVVW